MANLSHVYPLVSLALNVGTIAKLLYLRWFAKEQYKNLSGQSIELSLLVICLVSLLGQFGLMIYADHKAEIQANVAMATLILNLVSDCSTLCEAYIGLAVNGTLRKALCSMLFKRASIFHQDIP